MSEGPDVTESGVRGRSWPSDEHHADVHAARVETEARDHCGERMYPDEWREWRRPRRIAPGVK